MAEPFEYHSDEDSPGEADLSEEDDDVSNTNDLFDFDNVPAARRKAEQPWSVVKADGAESVPLNPYAAATVPQEVLDKKLYGVAPKPKADWRKPFTPLPEAFLLHYDQKDADREAQEFIAKQSALLASVPASPALTAVRDVISFECVSVLGTTRVLWFARVVVDLTFECSTRRMSGAALRRISSFVRSSELGMRVQQRMHQTPASRCAQTFSNSLVWGTIARCVECANAGS